MASVKMFCSIITMDNRPMAKRRTANSVGYGCNIIKASICRFINQCCVSGLCNIPVARAILPEGKKGSRKKPWLDLFQCLQNGIPENWEVLVMADRGLYAHWLYDAIC